ncbi:hypothetical protein [Flavobacterium hydrophilum]|nr:hypothetical protein [Flavobacterium hydrophilum]
MKGLVDHFIISIYDLENEIKQDLINKKLKIDKDSDEEIDNLINQLFGEV